MNLQEAYYELRFVDAFRSAKGGAFQTFFEKLMGLAYKSDFMACRPWGNQGDRKNDGFLKSERRLFQVYAPTEMDAARTIAKINEDFDGAIVHWGMYFDKWVFAHNAVDGLPPHVQAALLKFENAHTGVTVEPWGLEEFKVVFRRVTSDDRQSWFGFSPTDETKAHLGFKDLQIVLESIATRQSPAIQPIKDVPMGKIEANSLSESVAILLKAGMTKAPLVESFFGNWHDESLGERIAESFKEKYRVLSESFMPNDVFVELQKWAGGGGHDSAAHEVAVLTVMAYYFERCDIFRAPREVAS